MDRITISLALVSFLALGAAAVAAWSVVLVRQATLYRYATRTELLKVKQELTELVGIATDLQEQFKRMRSRIGMRELRDRQGNDGPDPSKEPEAYRRFLEAKHADILTRFRKPEKAS